MKTIVDEVMSKRKANMSKLQAAEAANRELQDEVARKERDNHYLRRTMIESVGGISFKTFDKNGQAHVHVKKDISDAEKYAIQVG